MSQLGRIKVSGQFYKPQDGTPWFWFNVGQWFQQHVSFAWIYAKTRLLRTAPQPLLLPPAPGSLTVLPAGRKLHRSWEDTPLLPPALHFPTLPASHLWCSSQPAKSCACTTGMMKRGWRKQQQCGLSFHLPTPSIAPCCVALVKVQVKPSRSASQLQWLHGLDLASYVTDPSYSLFLGAICSFLSEMPCHHKEWIMHICDIVSSLSL